MSEGFLCPICTVKLADIRELADHAKTCGSVGSKHNDSTHVKNQQRVWQDTCTHLHNDAISYDNYARVIGPKMYSNRHWMCKSCDVKGKKSKVSVREAANENAAKLRTLKEGEIIFEIDSIDQDNRTWIKFFDVENNQLAWAARTSRSGKTTRLVEVNHPKPRNYVHPLAQGNTPTLKSKKISRVNTPKHFEDIPEPTVYKAGLGDSDDEDSRPHLHRQTMARLRQRQMDSDMHITQRGAALRAQNLPVSDSSDEELHAERRLSSSSRSSQDRPLSEKQRAALPGSRRSSFANSETNMIPEPIKVEVPQQDEEVSKALALVKQRDAEIATLKSEVAALKQKVEEADDAVILHAQTRDEVLALRKSAADLQSELSSLRGVQAAADRAESDLAAANVKAAKLERNLLQKAKEVATLQKNFEIVKTEYNKLKQAKTLLVREVLKLRAEVVEYKGKLVLAQAAKPAPQSQRERETSTKAPAAATSAAPTVKPQSNQMSSAPNQAVSTSGHLEVAETSPATGETTAAGSESKAAPPPPARADASQSGAVPSAVEKPSWATAEKTESDAPSKSGAPTPVKTDQSVSKFLNIFTKKPESPLFQKPASSASPRRTSVFGPPSPRRGSVFGNQDDPNSIGNKMKHFFEDTAKKARITATNVRSEAQASIIRMRDSMAKHKSKFVTFEEGEDIGILFADEVREDGTVFVYIKDFLKKPDGEWYQAELTGKLLQGDIIAKIGALSVEGMGVQVVEAHLDMCERPVT
eukprot:CAMPEP_0195516218 /NCGR_PEP_ID=MMETSP0794_2-20130614/7009_1 /TAXON_ID=515487 /ORGANISM="Stephanopyxis turris, Strain CCMP 815" /LENGTH=754 /DNA_ID=CAMNT_0040644757 /DNA_START=61 /DNA_END=2321 /DNA_ORIENTATION=+